MPLYVRCYPVLVLTTKELYRQFSTLCCLLHTRGLQKSGLNLGYNKELGIKLHRYCTNHYSRLFIKQPDRITDCFGRRQRNEELRGNYSFRITSFFYAKIDAKAFDQLRFEFAKSSNRSKIGSAEKGRKTFPTRRGKVKNITSKTRGERSEPRTPHSAEQRTVDRVLTVYFDSDTGQRLRS